MYAVAGSVSNPLISVAGTPTPPISVLNGTTDAYFGTIKSDGTTNKFLRLNSTLAGYTGNRETVMDIKRSNTTPLVNAACPEYLITGYSTSTGSLSKPWIVKVNCEGNVQWSKLFIVSGLGEEMRVASMTQSASGDAIYLCGLVKHESNVDYGFIARLDNVGNLIWIRKYGQTPPPAPSFFDRQSFKSIIINQYVRLVVCGTKYWHPVSAPNPSYSSTWVMEVNAATGATVTQNKLYSFAIADCDSSGTHEYRNYLIGNEIREFNPQGDANDAYYVSAVSRITDPTFVGFNLNFHHQSVFRINTNTFDMNRHNVFNRLFWTTISLDIRQTG